MKHTHHILPIHAGGLNDPSNLVKLTIQEHAEAHKKLWEEHGCWQDEIAWKALSGQVDKEEIISKVLSEAGKKGGNRPHLPETKEKISKILKSKGIKPKTCTQKSFMVNNGKIEKRIYEGQDIPEGFIIGGLKGRIRKTFPNGYKNRGQKMSPERYEKFIKMMKTADTTKFAIKYTDELREEKRLQTLNRTRTKTGRFE